MRNRHTPVPGWNDEPPEFGAAPQPAASPEQVDAAIAEATKEATERMGPSGSLNSVSTGGIRIDPGGGLSAYEGGRRKTSIEPDGDFFVGADIDTIEGVSFAVFVNAQDWNAETMEEGDILIGNNSDDSSNVFWDHSEGRFNFRLGQTVTAYMDTDGTLNFTAGTIGGWTISTDYIQDAAGMVGLISSVSVDDDLRIWAGNANQAIAPFRVYESGRLYAENVEITGDINATGGTIGGFVIDQFTISALDNDLGIVLDTFNTAMIRVGNMVGNYIEIDGFNEWIRSSNFSAGAAGFNISSSTGDAEFNNITARGELKTFLLTSSNQMAVGGNIIVSKDAGKLGADVSSGATTVNFGKSMTVGDWIKIQGPDSAGSNALEWMLIGSLVSGTTYNVTRNVDGSGANAWLKDSPFVVIGASGDNRIEITAGATGSIQLITQGATWNTQTVQASMSTFVGAITAGGGEIRLDQYGIFIGNSLTSGFQIEDASGNRDKIHIVADANNDFEIVNLARGPNGKISFYIKDTSGNTRRPLFIQEHTTFADMLHVAMDIPAGGGAFTMGGEVVLYAGAGADGQTIQFNGSARNIDFKIGSDTITNFFHLDASAETLTINGALSVTGSFSIASLEGGIVINEAGGDFDTRIEGDTNPYVFMVDAGLNRVEIGRDDGGRTAVHIFDPSSTTYFNEPNYDIDFKVEGDTDEDLFWADAGLNAIGMGGAAQSGYKLKVTGKTNVTSTYDVNGTPIGYPLVASGGGASGWAPADSTTYFWGSIMGIDPTTTAARRRFYIPRAGTVVRIDVVINCAAGASNESATLSFRLNNTTDTTLSSSVVFNAPPYIGTFTGLSTAVALGDYFEMKLVTPAWATNPTNVVMSAVVWIVPS